MGIYADALVDHVLYDSARAELNKLTVETGRMTEFASDHSPVIADFRWRE